MTTMTVSLPATSPARKTNRNSGFLSAKVIGGGMGSILVLAFLQMAGAFVTHTGSQAATCVQSTGSYSQAASACGTNGANANATTVTATTWGPSALPATNPEAQR